MPANFRDIPKNKFHERRLIKSSAEPASQSFGRSVGRALSRENSCKHAEAALDGRANIWVRRRECWTGV